MTNEDHDGAAASTDNANGSDAPRPGSSLRTSLEEAKLRLDSPLFKRDAGMSAGEMPKFRELTWDHVVNPTSQVPSTASEGVAAGAPGAGAALLERLQEGADEVRLRALRASVPDVEAPPVATDVVSRIDLAPPPAADAVPETIEDLLTRRPSISEPVEVIAPTVSEPAAVPANDRVSEPGWSTDTQPGPSVNELVALVRQDVPRAPRVVPSVGDLADLVQQDASSVHEVAPPVVEVAPPVVEVAPPVVEVAPPVVEVAPPEVARAPEVVNPAPPLPQPPAPAATAGRSVEAELDRLAYVPDREEESGPVAVPAIAVVSPTPARVPAMAPTLSHAVTYAPRASGAPGHKTSYADLVTPTQPVVTKRKRHVVRKLFTLVIVLGLIGGGVYGVKRYVLDAVKWSGDAGTLAAEVESQRGLEFSTPVVVTELAVDEYARSVAELALGISDETSESTAAELRAVGLLSGELDLRAVGMAALADSPAYYDPASKTIMVVQGLPADLRTFAMHRALTLALLDQEFGWGNRALAASPSQARGIRALYDGDALETATSMVQPTERAAIITQVFGLYSTYEIPVTPSPFGSAVVGRLGLATAPYFSGLDAADRLAAETEAAPTDGEVLDLRRLLDGKAETPSIGSRGMLFWYHVLAARVDNDLAWRVALSWKDDDVQVAPGPSGICVTAVLKVDALALAGAQQALQTWAAGAPASAPASIVVSDVVSAESTAAGIREIAITACDPGPTVQTNDGRERLSLGGAPLRAAQYERLATSQPTLTPQQIACTVFGLDAVAPPADERGIMDPAEGWPALAAHPVPDPATSGCVPA